MAGQMAGQPKFGDFLHARPFARPFFVHFRAPPPKWLPAVSPAIFGSGPVSHSVAGQPCRESGAKYRISGFAQSLLTGQVTAIGLKSIDSSKKIRAITRPALSRINSAISLSTKAGHNRAGRSDFRNQRDSNPIRGKCGRCGTLCPSFPWLFGLPWKVKGKNLLGYFGVFSVFSQDFVGSHRGRRSLVNLRSSLTKKQNS